MEPLLHGSAAIGIVPAGPRPRPKQINTRECGAARIGRCRAATTRFAIDQVAVAEGGLETLQLLGLHGRTVAVRTLACGKRRGAARGCEPRTESRDSPNHGKGAPAVTPVPIHREIVVERGHAVETESLHYGDAGAVHHREILIGEHSADAPGRLEVGREHRLEGWRPRPGCPPKTVRRLRGALDAAAATRFRPGRDPW